MTTVSTRYCKNNKRFSSAMNLNFSWVTVTTAAKYSPDDSNIVLWAYH